LLVVLRRRCLLIDGTTIIYNNNIQSPQGRRPLFQHGQGHAGRYPDQLPQRQDAQAVTGLSVLAFLRTSVQIGRVVLPRHKPGAAPPERLGGRLRALACAADGRVRVRGQRLCPPKDGTTNACAWAVLKPLGAQRQIFRKTKEENDLYAPNPSYQETGQYKHLQTPNLVRLPLFLFYVKKKNTSFVAVRTRLPPGRLLALRHYRCSLPARSPAL